MELSTLDGNNIFCLGCSSVLKKKNLFSSSPKRRLQSLLSTTRSVAPYTNLSRTFLCTICCLRIIIMMIKIQHCGGFLYFQEFLRDSYLQSEKLCVVDFFFSSWLLLQTFLFSFFFFLCNITFICT